MVERPWRCCVIITIDRYFKTRNPTMGRIAERCYSKTDILEDIKECATQNADGYLLFR